MFFEDGYYVSTGEHVLASYWSRCRQSPPGVECRALTQACCVFLRQVCLAAVGLVCDLCRALMTNILPFCDEIMQLLLENLGVSTHPSRAGPFGEIIEL